MAHTSKAWGGRDASRASWPCQTFSSQTLLSRDWRVIKPSGHQCHPKTTQGLHPVTWVQSRWSSWTTKGQSCHSQNSKSFMPQAQMQLTAYQGYEGHGLILPLNSFSCHWFVFPWYFILTLLIHCFCMIITMSGIPEIEYREKWFLCATETANAA